jgi:hypothetical protein
MFFLFGWRNKAKVLGQVERMWAKCSRPTMHAAIASKKWFTLFFIPVIPLGSRYLNRCGVCGLTTPGLPQVPQVSAEATSAGA